MSGCVGKGRQMYSIEQIELIRRLRNSGITKEEVIQAFDSFDRLDNDLGHLYSVPVSQPTHVQSMPAESAPNPQVRASVQSNPSHQFVHGTNHQRTGTQLNNVPTNRAFNAAASKQVYPVSVQANTHAQAQYQFPERHGVKRPHTETINLDDTEPDHPVTCLIDDDNSNNSSASNISEEIAKELRDFLNQGIQKVKDEISWFIGQYRIQLGQMAAMSGQSFATITQFLNGDFRDIPDTCVQAICSWYLAYKKAVATSTPPPPTTPPAVSSQMAAVTTSNQKVKLPDGQEILIPQQRRERFTFREKHLEVLETCFNENPYPSHEQREAIAHMCNMAVSNMGNRILHDREKVTPHMVLNWFANRRKEVKKIAREEGIPESEVVLPSKVYKRPVGFDITMDNVTLSPVDQGQNDQADGVSSPVVKNEPG